MLTFQPASREVLQLRSLCVYFSTPARSYTCAVVRKHAALRVLVYLRSLLPPSWAAPGAMPQMERARCRHCEVVPLLGLHGWCSCAAVAASRPHGNIRHSNALFLI
jgi:hypothetical protein